MIIPGATVVVKSKDTNAEQRVQVNEDGNYVVTPPLVTGTYTVVVEQANFKRYEQAVTLNAKDRRAIDVVAKRKTSSQTVPVTACAIRESPPVTIAFDLRCAGCPKAPLNSFRDFLKLAGLVPGVSSAPFGRSIANRVERAAPASQSMECGATRV